MNQKTKERVLRIAMLMITDMIVFFVAYYLAFLLRFNFVIPDGAFWSIGRYIIGAMILKFLIFIVTGMYRTLWRYASIHELLQIFLVVLGANFIINSVFLLFSIEMPLSVMVLDFLLELVFIGGIRMFYRVLRRAHIKLAKPTGIKKERTLIFGAGEAGIQILKELMISSKAYEVVGFLDDDQYKKGKKINGYPIFGNRKLLSQIVEKKQIELIVIACPSKSTKVIKEIAELAHATGAAVKILPNFSEILNYEVNLNHLRDLQIEDLLNREEVVLDKEKITTFIEGKVVMVTGGSGSIGSELCRQIIRYKPKKMIIVDIYENTLYYLELELCKFLEKMNTPIKCETTIELEIASIRDRKHMYHLFETYQPEIVFHAAAHKHVPLMEKTPKEAVKNNVFGTKNLLDAANAYGVKKFVQISTDKAVKPTSVMGTTKRVCEMLIQTYNQTSTTDYVAVRFGNVLGSNGSVIPIFKKQIENGGPVTVTDKNIERYFMTIPEATQLVLQAGSIAKGGEIFVLDMGEPVKIIELAENMIKLSGYEPYSEMPIVFTGLRPGEKLYEELSYDLKCFDSTRHKDIFVEKIQFFQKSWIDQELEKLLETIESAKNEDVVKQLKTMVPDFVPYIKKDLKKEHG